MYTSRFILVYEEMGVDSAACKLSYKRPRDRVNKAGVNALDPNEIVCLVLTTMTLRFDLLCGATVG